MYLRVGPETVTKTENLHQPVTELRYLGNKVRLLAKGPRHLCSLLSAFFYTQTMCELKVKR